MPRYVLDGIVKYAAPELKPTLLAKANMETTIPLLEAEKMANFAQSMTMEERPARALGRHVNAIEEASISVVEALVSNHCKRKGHTAEKCHSKKRDSNLKNRFNTKKGHHPRKRNENHDKEKNWTLFITDQAPDGIVCSSNDKNHNSENDIGEDENNENDIGEDENNNTTPLNGSLTAAADAITGNASLLTSNISSASTFLYLTDGSTV
jgi:hypothetical protein